MVQLWCKALWQFLRKLEIDLPQTQLLPLLGIHPKDSIPYYKDTCLITFIADLFTMDRTWRQPRCPSGIDSENVVNYEILFSCKET